jgi:exosortase/archaeosortase
MNTVSTSSQLGRPATNIGAIVVTNSSEMMRGLVRAMKSDASRRTVAVGMAVSLMS